MTGTQTQQIKDQTEAKIQGLDRQKQEDYLKIVVAGMKVLYTPQTHRMELGAIAKITGPRDVPANVAQGVLKLILLVYRESAGKMSIPMSIPAAVVLAMYLLEDIQKVKGITLTPDLIAQTTRAVVMALYQKYGIKPDQVQQVVKQGYQRQPGKAPAAPPPQGAV